MNIQIFDVTDCGELRDAELCDNHVVRSGFERHPSSAAKYSDAHGGRPLGTTADGPWRQRVFFGR
jgi:hypothetical protein